MVTFEEALRIAEKRKGGIDSFVEFDNAYSFGSSRDRNLIGPSPIVVIKETGEYMPLPLYIATMGGKEVGSGSL